MQYRHHNTNGQNRKNHLNLKKDESQRGQNKQKSSKTLGKKALIVLAICFSVVLGSISYKIALSQKNNNGGSAILAGMAGTTTNSADLIKNALQEAEISAFTVSDDVSANPFAIKSSDSASDRVAKSLFASYMNTGDSEEISPDDANNVAGLVISQINQRDLPQPQYSTADVKTFNTKNPDQIKQYGNIVAGTVVQNYKVIANNKTGGQQDLKTVEEVYINIGKYLIKQSAPAEIASEHLELANSFLILADAMKMIEKQSTDPVQALLGVKILQSVSTSQQNVLIKIANYFETSGIIFTSSDVGVIWNSYKGVPFGIPAEISIGNQGATQ